MSEIENNSGRSRPTENEFNRIVEVLNSTKHKAMFRTWVANFTNRERQVKTFDGAALKFIRIKKNLNLHKASKQTELSAGQISKIENGLKPVNLDLRNRIMIAYGYSPTSFKNLSTDPVRSKVVPISYKLEILLNTSEESQIEKIFSYIQSCIIQDQENNNNELNIGDSNGSRTLIQAVAVLAIVAASTGQLPKIINYVHKAQIQLIQESKATKWPKAVQLPAE